MTEPFNGSPPNCSSVFENDHWKSGIGSGRHESKNVDMSPMRQPALRTFAPPNPVLLNYASLSNMADGYASAVPSRLSPNLTGDTLVSDTPESSAFTRIATQTSTEEGTRKNIAEKLKRYAKEYSDENAGNNLGTDTIKNAVGKIEDDIRESTRARSGKQMWRPSSHLGSKLAGEALLAGDAANASPKSASSRSGASLTWASEQKRRETYPQKQLSRPTSVLPESAFQTSSTEHAKGHYRTSGHDPKSERQPEALHHLMSMPQRNWSTWGVSDHEESTDIPDSSSDVGTLYHIPPSLCLSGTTLGQRTERVDRPWSDGGWSDGGWSDKVVMPPHLPPESLTQDLLRVIRTRRQQSKRRANVNGILTIEPNVRLGGKSLIGRLRTKFAFRRPSTSVKEVVLDRSKRKEALDAGELHAQEVLRVLGSFPHPLAELDSKPICELPGTELSRSTTCSSVLPTPTRFLATSAVARNVSHYLGCEVSGLLRPQEPAISRRRFSFEDVDTLAPIGLNRHAPPGIPCVTGITAADRGGTGCGLKPALHVSGVSNRSGGETYTAGLLEGALPKLEDNGFKEHTLRQTPIQRDGFPIPYPRSFRFCKPMTRPIRLSSSKRIKKSGISKAGTTRSQVQPSQDVPDFEAFSQLFDPASATSPTFSFQRLGGSAHALVPEDETYAAYTSMAGLPQDSKSSQWSNATVAISKDYGTWYAIERMAPLLTYLGLVASAIFLEVERKVRHIGQLISARQKVPEGLVRINWTCTCGDRLYDDFLELQPGAANCLQALLNKPRTHTPSSQSQSSSSSNEDSIFSTSSSHRSTSSATSGDISDARAESSSNPDKNRRSQSVTANPFVVPFGPDAQPLNLLTCVDEERFSPKLSHLCMEPSQVKSDKDVAVSLRQLYTCVNDNWYKKFRLRGLQTIEFVQFEVHRSTRFADIRKRPDMPPPPYLSVYDFEHGQLIPPVGSMYLMHLLKHPEDYDSEQITYSRMPKRRGRLDAGVGWGIHLVEGFLASRVWALVNSFFLLASITFVAVWLTTKPDDLQGAFAVTAWMCMFAGLIVAWAQACLG